MSLRKTTYLSHPSENIPAIKEEPAAPSSQRQKRSPSRSQSFTGISSDEIGDVTSPSEDSDSDCEPLFKEQLVPYAPDGGYGWVVVFAAFLSNFVLDGISVSQSILMEDIRKASGLVNITGKEACLELQVSRNCTPTAPVYEITVAMYGLISSVLLCVTLAGGPFISLFTDSFGFRKVGVCGSILASLGIFLSWLASRNKPNIWAIITCFGGITGLGFGMMFQPSVIIVGIYFDKWRPLATGIAMMGTGAGTIIFPPLLAMISKTWSWHEAYLFQAVVALISATFALLYIPLPTKRVKTNVRKSEADGSNLPVAIEPETLGLSSITKSMGSLMTSPTFLLISISGTITLLGLFAPYAFLVDKAMKEIGVDEKSATFLLSIIGISNTCGRLIFGLISCHPWVNCLKLTNGGLTIAGIATMLIPFTNAYYQLVIYCVIFGFGLAIFTILRSTIVVKLMGMNKFNSAFGLSLFFMGFGTLLGNPLGGWLKDTTGTYNISFYAAGAYLLLSAIMCYPLQSIRDWENRGTITVPSIITPDSIEQEHYAQRRYSLSVSLHI